MTRHPDYITLGTLAQQLEVYEDMPVSLQHGLQHSVRNTLITNAVAIPVALLLPQLLWGMLPFFEILDVTGGLAYALVGIISGLSIPIAVLNAVSLAIVLLLLYFSQGMTRPVPQSMHWLAWGTAFPSGATVISGAVLGGLFALLFVITLVIWIVAIILGILLVALVLSALAASA